MSDILNQPNNLIKKIDKNNLIKKIDEFNKLHNKITYIYVSKLKSPRNINNHIKQFQD